MARERTRTRPLFVPTQRVGEVEVVFSMKVEEKWTVGRVWKGMGGVLFSNLALSPE